MKSERMTAGRPRASSRGTIEEAAAELFLEQSYAGTTIDEITRRAGVSRATFFNYFDSKGDLLWMDADHAIEMLECRLHAGDTVIDAVNAVAADVGPERVPLAVTQSDVMGTGEELVASGLARVARATGLIRAALQRQAVGGRDELALTVRAHCISGAIVAAWGAWINGGVDRAPLSNYVERALALVQLE
ncbi:MAG: TetR family transcriptional regulator [Microbacteriaceae bacterium]|nr:TetR family transcriptional regulator [Microbacteriaceae bacterium]